MKLSQLFAGILSLSAMFLVSSTAQAKDYTSEATHLAITAPDDWAAETGDTLTLSAPDSMAHVVMMTVPADDLETALASLDTELSKIFKNAKVEGEAKTVEINGLPCIHISGTGENDGVALEFTLAVVDAGNDCMIVLAFGTPNGLKEHQEEAVGIINSIHKPE